MVQCRSAGQGLVAAVHGGVERLVEGLQRQSLPLLALLHGADSLLALLYIVIRPQALVQQLKQPLWHRLRMAVAQPVQRRVERKELAHLVGNHAASAGRPVAVEREQRALVQEVQGLHEQRLHADPAKNRANRAKIAPAPAKSIFVKIQIRAARIRQNTNIFWHRYARK